VAIGGGCAGVVPPPGCGSEEEGGRIGGRGGGWPLAPASAHETDAQIISAPHELDVVVIAPRNNRLHLIPMPETTDRAAHSQPGLILGQR
jgi:hypothetical protein